MRAIKITLLTFLSFFITTSLSQPRGKLFIIGGGERSPYKMKKFVELAGGTESKFLIIPMASEEAESEAIRFVKEFNSYGCKNVDYIIFNRETADQAENLKKMENINAVFFSGGDQSRLTAALAGTKLLGEIKKIYSKGGIIGGTSAGAAVMSKIMITGDELINKDTDNLFHFIKKGNVKTSEGFGFIEEAIIDQHFITRKRHNRLLNIVLEHPNLLGVGIDEETAIIVYPNRTFEVLGENSVLVYDASNAKAICTDSNNNLAGVNIKMHLLKSGDRFNLKTKKVIVGKSSK